MLVATLALWLAAARSTAAPPDIETRAVQLIEAGISLLKAGELEGARSAFLKARDLVPEKASPHRFLGLVEARLGHCAEAVSALDTFLLRVPPNDPRTVEAITVRDRCKDELAPKPGTLEADSTPPGAELRLDDESAPARGTTPFRDDALPAGPHVLFLRKPGYASTSRGFTIVKKETVHLHFDLVPQSLPPQPTVAAVAAEPAVHPFTQDPASTPTPLAATSVPAKASRPRYWFIGVVAGVVVAAVVGVGLGVGLSSSREPVFTPVGMP